MAGKVKDVLGNSSDVNVGVHRGFGIILKFSPLSSLLVQHAHVVCLIAEIGEELMV